MFVVANAALTAQQEAASLAVQGCLATAHLALLGGIGLGQFVQLLLVSWTLHFNIL